MHVVARLPSGLQLGDVVSGKYRLLRIVGSGAMGVVVAAHHRNLDRTVAIKFLTGDAVAHPDAVARFVREARAVARIRSPHVVRVHDVAELADGTPYIELEYLEGHDLAERLARDKRLPVGTAVDFVLQACEAIAEAHELGIIHRDLKPANLFLAAGPGNTEIVKVVDFGISKAVMSVSSTLPSGAFKAAAVTTEPGPFGSPSYMSPEQMQSARDVDRRTDVWSLGVTLCELVTGEVPYRGGSIVELYATIRSGEPLRLRQRFPGLPVALESAILGCLAFDRDLRFESVDALSEALLPLAPNRAASYVQRLTASRRADPDADRSTARSPEGAESRTSEDAVVFAPGVRHRTGRAARVAIPLALVAVGGIGATVVALRSSTPPPPVVARSASAAATAACVPSPGAPPGECAPSPALAPTSAQERAEAPAPPSTAPATEQAAPAREPKAVAPATRPSARGQSTASWQKPEASSELALRAAPADIVADGGRDRAARAGNDVSGVASIPVASASATAAVVRVAPSSVAPTAPPIGVSSLESILEKRE
jgi:serine/threonine-protein kinase